MVRDNRHDSVHLFGAICPDRDVGAAIIMPYVNTEAMNEHLKEISTIALAIRLRSSDRRSRSRGAPGAHAALVCDGAGWHQTGGRLRVPDNIVLVPLPSYAPELNPMENVWDYLRQNKLCSSVWDSTEAIIEACDAAWNFLVDDPKRIRSIGSRQWARVSL